MVATLDLPAQKTVNALPVLDLEINAIATANGLQPDFVANQISQAGGMVAQVGERFLTTRVAWENFVERYVTELRDRLQGKPTQIGAEPPKPKRSKTKPEGTTLRFKAFKLSNSYAKSLGNFLDAQQWPAEKRIEVVEAIAQLPLAEGEASTVAEQCIKRMIGTYPAAKRRGNTTRQGLIEAAKAMIGTLQLQE